MRHRTILIESSLHGFVEECVKGVLNEIKDIDKSKRMEDDFKEALSWAPSNKVDGDRLKMPGGSWIYLDNGTGMIENEDGTVERLTDEEFYELSWAYFNPDDGKDEMFY